MLLGLVGATLTSGMVSISLENPIVDMLTNVIQDLMKRNDTAVQGDSQCQTVRNPPIAFLLLDYMRSLVYVRLCDREWRFCGL